MWYFKNTSGDQGLIIDEETGRSVAVTYETKDAPLIAAAPELLAALEMADATIRRLKPPSPHDSTQGTRDVIRNAIAKATQS